MTVDHPSVKSIWFQAVFDDAMWRRQVVVETSLILDASHRNYNAPEVANLEQVIESFMKAHPFSIHSAILRPWRPNF